MRTLLALLFVWIGLGLGAIPGAAAQDGPAATPPPASLKELGQRLDELATRIGRLLEEARRDPDERKIDKYKAYSADELKLRRRSVDAEALVEFMVDPSKNHLLRDKAKAAIVRGAQVRGDPDLSQTEKQGRQTKRAYFSERYVIKHLRHEDGVARKLTQELLEGLWRIGGSVPEIAAYDPSDDKTWQKAYNAWKKYLRRN